MEFRRHEHPHDPSNQQSVAMAFVCLTTIPQATAQKTPNLLLFMADDMTFKDITDLLQRFSLSRTRAD